MSELDYYKMKFLLFRLRMKGKRGTLDSRDGPKEWITVNGTPIPVDSNGNLQGSIGCRINKISRGLNKMDITQNLSGSGANTDIPPFSQSNLNDHWIGGRSDHSSQYPNMTKEQYAQRALELVSSATDENITGYKASNGAIVRYDRSTNDWVKGYTNGIATMFKPSDGVNYYNRTKKIDGGI